MHHLFALLSRVTPRRPPSVRLFRGKKRSFRLMSPDKMHLSELCGILLNNYFEKNAGGKNEKS